MRFCCFFIFCCSPLLGQFHAENPDFEQLKRRGRLPGTAEAHFKMALAHEVLYGTTDKSRIQQVFDAAIFLQKAVKKDESEVWTTLPHMEKALRKNRENAGEIDFLNALIDANAALKQAMNTRDLAQRRANLHLVFEKHPRHIPTLMAVVKTEWALKNHELGDTYLKRLMKMEPVESHLPLLIMKAHMIRRRESIEQGLEILYQAAKLNSSPSNQVGDLIETWFEEINAASDNPETLFQLKAPMALKTLTKKVKSAKAKHYYGKLLLENGDLVNGTRQLRASMRKEPENYHYFTAWANATDTWDTMGKWVKKRGPSFAGESGFDYYRSKNPKLPIEKKIQLLESVLETRPSHEKAHKYLRELRDQQGNFEALNGFLEKLVDQSGTADIYFFYTLAILASKSYERGFPVVLEGIASFPEDKKLLVAAADLSQRALKNGFTKHQQQISYRLIKAALRLEQNFDYSGAAKMVERSIPLLPDHPEVSLLAGNMHYLAGNEKGGKFYFEMVVSQYPKTPFLYELIGDGYFAKDLMKKAISNYKKALQLDDKRSQILRKLQMAKKRKKDKKLTRTHDTVNLPHGGVHSVSYGKINNKLLGRPSANYIGINRVSEEGRDSQYSRGFYMDESAPLLRDFFNHILDLASKYEKNP